MKYLLSIDPGMESGITLGHYDDNTAYERDAYWQIEGGIDGFENWHNRHSWDDSDYGKLYKFEESGLLLPDGIEIVSERFIPLATDRAFRINDLEPIRIEGALKAWGHDIIWQRADCQILSGGETPEIRKKRSGEILKRGGLWLTGKNVGSGDANDVISAQKHALYYMMFTLKHPPTLARYGVLNAD